MDLQKIANNIIDELSGRRGFNGWWNDIDEDTQDEIKTCIADIIDDELANTTLTFFTVAGDMCVVMVDGLMHIQSTGEQIAITPVDEKTIVVGNND